MPGARRAKRTASHKNSQIKPSGKNPGDVELSKYDGRENLQAGDKGKEPGGRWSPAYYETPACIVGKVIVRKP